MVAPTRPDSFKELSIQVKPFLWLIKMELETAQQLFEDIDGSLYWKSNFRKSRIGKKAGTPHSKGYVQITYKKNIYMEHRLVFLLHHGYLPKLIDHINGNKSDNKICNLREASLSQNAQNMKKPSSNTSGIKGVTWSKNNRNWRVQLSIDGKNKFIGAFKQIDLARQTIEQARRKYHGVFANHG